MGLNLLRQGAQRPSDKSEPKPKGCLLCESLYHPLPLTSGIGGGWNSIFQFHFSGCFKRKHEEEDYSLYVGCFPILPQIHLAVAPKTGIPKWVARSASGNMETKTCGLISPPIGSF